MATRLIGELRDSANIPLASMSEQDICERVLLAQANQGAKLLQNGTVSTPADIDAVLLLTGALPSWRGGAMFVADEMTPLRVLGKLRAFAAEGPDVWEPAILWEELVKNGDQICDLNNL
jgi:3-hydroxyacyl-CoA dehydrogenase